MGNHSKGFLFCQDDGKLRGAVHPFDPGHIVKRPIEHLLVKEEESAKSLVLGRSGHVAVNSEVTLRKAAVSLPRPCRPGDAFHGKEFTPVRYRRNRVLR